MTEATGKQGCGFFGGDIIWWIIIILIICLCFSGSSCGGFGKY